MQTIIGIVICLIVIVIFAIGYMNSYEGLTTSTATTTPSSSTTTTTTSPTTTSPTGSVSLKTVVENAEKASTAKETTIGLSTNKNDYAELINHLLDYYDNRIIYEIANAKQDENEDYDLSSIVQYKNIKETLIQSLEYVS